MIIKREILTWIRAHLDAPEITLISGARQVGKTTLMNILISELRKKGKNVLFLSLDLESEQPFFLTQDTLIQRIRLEFGDQVGFVFLDEIQRKENAGLFLKGIYDMRSPWKFIISGSGSIELKEKISESLAGRKRIFEVRPVSFNEFLDFRTDYKYSEKLELYFSVNQVKALTYFNEYLNFGGYPRVITAPSMREKLLTINEIYQSYIDRDIRPLISGNRPESFSKLMKLLAAQTGQMLNLSNLSNRAQLSIPALQKYLWLAEKTFFIKFVTPYSNNVSKEITKAPVVYLNDHGMRNFAISAFGNIQRTQDYGFVFQNLVCNTILSELHGMPFSLHFWRTTDKAEVDFVISRMNDPIAVEVKFSDLKKPSISRSLRSFIEKYKPSEAWVVNLAFNETMMVGTTRIRFVSFFGLQNMLRQLVNSIETAYKVEEKAFPYRIIRRRNR